MKSTVAKLGFLGLGAYVVSQLLAKVSANAQAAVRSRGNTVNGMGDYDRVAEALGCNCGGSFSDLEVDDAGGLGSLKKKLKKATKSVSKAVQKPVQQVKKVANVVKRDVGKVTKQVRRDVKNVTKPLVRDFRKGAKLMKTDFKRAGALFGGGSKKKGPSAAVSPSTQEVEYYDAEGRRITEAEYNALMAQLNQPSSGQVVTDDAGVFSMDEVLAMQDQEYGMLPADAPGADVQSDIPGESYSMDEVAALAFQDEFGTDGSETNPVQALTYGPDAMQAYGYADGTVPYGGAMLWMQGEDPWAPQHLPEAIREGTLDAFAAQQSDDDSLIMPVAEPSVPFTGDEMVVWYEQETPYYPEPASYGNSQPGSFAPSSYGDAFGYDVDWGMEGLGAVVDRQTRQRLVVAPRSLMRPSTYGWIFAPPKNSAAKQRTPIPIIADRRGNAFIKNGGSLHRIGSIDDLAGGEGLGCAMFARDVRASAQRVTDTGLSGWGDFKKKLEKGAKKVATYTTPSGFAYSQVKKRPKLYKEYRKVAVTAKPYVMIAGGTALSVVSLGAASPAGAAMIASGVVALGAQAYGDVKTREAEKALDKAIEQDRIQAAIASTDVINETQRLQPSGGAAPGEIPGGDFPWEFPGDGVAADFLDLMESFI